MAEKCALVKNQKSNAKISCDKRASQHYTNRVHFSVHAVLNVWYVAKR